MLIHIPVKVTGADVFSRNLAGTKTCGGQTLMNSDQNDGLE